MSSILHRLEPRHLLKGWAIYWRMTISFWVYLISFSAIGYLAMGLDTALAEKYPFFRPLLAAMLMGICAFPLSALNRLLTHICHSWEYKSQYGIFQNLDRIIRGLFCLILALGLLLYHERQSLWLASPVFKGIFMVFGFTLAGILGVFVALFGWFKDQADI